MKTIKRISLKEVASQCSVMDAKEIASFLGGGDNYSVDSSGNFEKTGENDYDYDVVSAGSNSYDVDGSLSVTTYVTTGSVQGTQVEGGDYDLFKFLADNTDVEWGAVFSGGVNAQDWTDCTIQTTHDDDSCQMEIDMSDPYKYNTMVHSHPKRSENSPSEQDEATWSDLYDSTNINNFGIYYSRSGRVVDYSK